VRQKKMLKLQPELQSLKEQYAQQPHIYLEKMTDLYRRHGLSMMDGRSLMGALLQMPVLLGMFQALRQMGEGAKFLWVANLVKPDTLFALLAGAATALMVMVNPDIPEQMRLWLIIVPSVIAFVVALKFCSALSLYWIATNAFSALQTFAVHRVVARRLRSGTLKI
jgi:YidC/Oxa1 family membrane protein insertase